MRLWDDLVPSPFFIPSIKLSSSIKIYSLMYYTINVGFCLADDLRKVVLLIGDKLASGLAVIYSLRSWD
jgi:hypothetical protein